VLALRCDTSIRLEPIGGLTRQAVEDCGKVIVKSYFTKERSMNATVKLSSKYQVVIPRAAREALGLEAGDELLILCKADRVVMMPKPKNYSQRTAGLHREIWRGAQAYLKDERDSW